MVKHTPNSARDAKIYDEDHVLKFTKSLIVKESTLKKAYSCLDKAAKSKKLTVNSPFFCPNFQGASTPLAW